MVVFDGLPLHPLIVHAPVVLIPLVAVGLGVLLVRPSSRATLAPIVAVLAVGAAITSMGAAWSGEQLADTLGHGDELDRHETWGELTRTLAVFVAVGAVGFAAADRFLPRRHAVTRVLCVVTTGVAIAAVGVVGVAGHAGATLAWEGKVPAVESATSDVTGGAPTEGGEDAVGREADVGTTAGSGDATTEPLDTQLPGAGTRGVDVILGEWALIPSVDQAPPGVITFRFRNLGTVPHALRIRTPGSGGDRLEWRSETIEPGETGLLVADLAPGTYEIDCPVEGEHGEHDELGMETRFAVQEDAKPLLPLSGADGPLADEHGLEGDDAPPPTSEEAESRTIEVRSFAFEPADVQVPIGTEVVWINRDPAPHTATGKDFDTGRLEQDARGAITFTEPGAFDYVCTIHPAMRGRVTVVPP